ncbi:MAG: 23S rRNA (adenine(2503)-C(2))-methyltransferase RlmN [Phycisphaerae bacterium]
MRRFSAGRSGAYNVAMDNGGAIEESVRVAGRSVFDLTRDGLCALLDEWKQPGYRATQILEWVYRRGARSYDEMTNLPKDVRSRLGVEVPLFRSSIVQRKRSGDGTVKLLLSWPDATTSECVLIPEGERQTACISTQVGCPVGCVFCASGMGGLEKSLSGGQIVEQAMRVRQVAGESSRLSNVVFMGLGEPLANYEATVQAVRTINADWGMGIGARRITISTIGLPKQIRRLAGEGLQITLAISLHAANDELRGELIPWAGKIPIEAVLEAANEYFERTGREITFEYLLLGGVNDSASDARQLAKLVRRVRSNVNLLVYNPVAGLPYHRPTNDGVRAFQEALRDAGVNAHVRTSRGRDIDAACGQLRRRHAESTSPAVTDLDVRGIRG